MADYRVYIFGKDGHIEQRVDVACNDDMAAIIQARAIAAGQTVEVWQWTRLVKRLNDPS